MSFCWQSISNFAHFEEPSSHCEKTVDCCSLHCKDKIPKFQNKYSQKRNISVSVPISTFMCLWVIYIFPPKVCLFCWRKYVDRSWDYINRSQTHECGIWGWGRAIPRKGIHKWDFRCSVVQIYAFIPGFDDHIGWCPCLRGQCLLPAGRPAWKQCIEDRTKPVSNDCFILVRFWVGTSQHIFC